MSDTDPSAPPHGWWIIMREYVSANRRPLVPPARMIAPALAASPTQIVDTGARMYCIVS